MKISFFKKKDIILIASILAAALLLLVLYFIGNAKMKEPKLEILVDSEIYGTYSLSEDQEIKIGETNICRIENGEVSMIEADCPDQICVKTKAITASGGSIVCLPNKVILQIIDSSGESGVDTVAG